MAGFFGGKDRYTRPGPGISKSEAEKTGISRYFDILGRRIWKIITVNFIYFLFSIIPLILMATVCNISITWTASTVLSETELQDWINNGGTMMVAIAALLIYTNCGGGPAACGLINVLRKYVSDTHAWAWQDFWDGFKTNLKYGIVAYIIDLFAALVLILNFGYYNSQQGLISALLMGLLTLVTFIWSMMHVYIYPIMTSFKLRLRDVYKNSFIMVIAKLPQTLGAFVLSFMLSFAVIAFGAATPYLMILIPLILFGLCEYTRLSIVYPLMVKYMADPAGKEDTFGEAVFNDDREQRDGKA